MNIQNKMRFSIVGTAVAALAVVAGTLAPTAAFAQSSKEKSRQSDKNLMRNIVIGAGAAAAYEALRGHTTNAVVLGAGAAYAGKKYEDARKAQSQDSGRYGYEDRGGYYGNDRYDRNDRDNRDSGYRYDRTGYDRRGSGKDDCNDRNDRNDRNGRNGQWDDRGRRPDTNRQNAAWNNRHDNGKHNGWYKNGKHD